MKYIERWGTKISYEVRGNGPPLMLCHGLLGDGSLWDQMTGQLEKNFTLIIPDLRGQRHSSTETPFTLWDSADDLMAILDAEKITQTQAIGFSMGGMAVLRMAIKYPARVSALGLISTAAGQEPAKSLKKHLRSASIIRLFGPLRIFESFSKDFMFRQGFEESHPIQFEAVMKSMRCQNKRSAAHAMIAVYCRDSVIPFLKQITAPTIIVVGTKDKSTPVKCSEEMARHLPHSKFFTIEGAGHMLPTECPQELVEHIVKFFCY